MNTGKSVDSSLVNQTLENMEKQIAILKEASDSMINKLYLVMNANPLVKDISGEEEKSPEVSPLVTRLEKNTSELRKIYDNLTSAYRRMEI